VQSSLLRSYQTVIGFVNAPRILPLHLAYYMHY